MTAQVADHKVTVAGSTRNVTFTPAPSKPQETARKSWKEYKSQELGRGSHCHNEFSSWGNLSWAYTKLALARGSLPAELLGFWKKLSPIVFSCVRATESTWLE